MGALGGVFLATLATVETRKTVHWEMGLAGWQRGAKGLGLPWGVSPGPRPRNEPMKWLRLMRDAPRGQS